jgi:hypothetical protein
LADGLIGLVQCKGFLVIGKRFSVLYWRGVCSDVWMLAHAIPHICHLARTGLGLTDWLHQDPLNGSKKPRGSLHFCALSRYATCMSGEDAILKKIRVVMLEDLVVFCNKFIQSFQSTASDIGMYYSIVH